MAVKTGGGVETSDIESEIQHFSNFMLGKEVGRIGIYAGVLWIHTGVDVKAYIENNNAVEDRPECALHIMSGLRLVKASRPYKFTTFPEDVFVDAELKAFMLKILSRLKGKTILKVSMSSRGDLSVDFGGVELEVHNYCVGRDEAWRVIDFRRQYHLVRNGRQYYTTHTEVN